MDLMSPTDSMFLIAETREHPFHVGGLALYEPPAGADADFVRELHEEMVAQTDIQPVFRKHPATILGGIANVGWTYDNDVDMDYHLRRSALPTPGRVRDLLELTSRLHGSLLDRHRPLWEAHLIEGLADGRFAVYTKMHHSLIDGVSALKLLMRTLSEDPDDTEVRVPWSLPRRKREHQSSSVLKTVTDTVGSVAGAGAVDGQAGAFGAAGATAHIAVRGAKDDVQREDRRRPPRRGPVLAAGAVPADLASGRVHGQRRGAHGLCRCATRLPAGAGRAAGPAVDRDGAGEPAHRTRGRRRRQYGWYGPVQFGYRSGRPGRAAEHRR